MRRFLLAFLAALGLLSSRAAAQSDLTISPDSSQTLVQKDLGGQRWAIVRDHASGRITGNVFNPGGGASQFVSCSAAGSEGANLLFDCFGATGNCSGQPCPWAPLGRVPLPASFFEIRTDQPVAPTLNALLGRWRVTAGDDLPIPSTWIFDTIQGNVVLGFSTLTDITGELFTPAGGESWHYVIKEPFPEDISDSLCWIYLLNLDGGTLRGVRRLTMRRGTGECTTVRSSGADETTVAVRQ